MDDSSKASNLQKYMKKNGFSSIEIDNVFKKAGDRRMSSKLKMQDKSPDELPVDEKNITSATSEDDGKYGSLTDVKDSQGADVDEIQSDDFGHGKSKKSKKPYLD